MRTMQYIMIHISILQWITIFLSFLVNCLVIKFIDRNNYLYIDIMNTNIYILYVYTSCTYRIDI